MIDESEETNDAPKVDAVIEPPAKEPTTEAPPAAPALTIVKNEKAKTGADLIRLYRADRPDLSKVKPGTKVEITGDELMVYENGFRALTERRAPNGKTEGIIAILYGEILRTPCEAFRSAMTKVDAELEDVELMDDNEAKVARILEARARKRELQEMKFTITAPALKLNRKNLPRAHKGKDGDMNPNANASIMIALTPLFFDAGTLEEVQKEGDGD